MSKNQVIILLSIIIAIFLVVGYFEIAKCDCQKNLENNSADVATEQENTINQNQEITVPVTEPTEQLNTNSMELQKEILKEGTGDKQIVNGETAVVHYTGWLTDGTKFDSSVDRGTPFEFKLGAGQVITGWDQGVSGMKVGEKRKLTIPYTLAYGEAGIPGAIPAKATLIFEVELLGIK